MPNPVNAAKLDACAAAIFEPNYHAEKVRPELLHVVGRALAESELLPEGNASADLQAILKRLNEPFADLDPGIATCRDLFRNYLERGHSF